MYVCHVNCEINVSCLLSTTIGVADKMIYFVRNNYWLPIGWLARALDSARLPRTARGHGIIVMCDIIFQGFR
jgi:hypothetical protein